MKKIQQYDLEVDIVTESGSETLRGGALSQDAPEKVLDQAVADAQRRHPGAIVAGSRIRRTT